MHQGEDNRLPFPVQCVSRTETGDRVAGLRFAARYTYHHGYYDHAEREFRGFGRVDQLDTEKYEALQNSGAAAAADPDSYEPPVLTKTWSHTGAYVRRDALLHAFLQEYWAEPWTLPDARVTAADDLPAGALDGLDAGEWRELARACKGIPLRREVYALDGSALAARPYSVDSHACHVQLLQPHAANAHAVFLATEGETLSCAYERDPADPRVTHTLNLAFDDLGNVRRAVTVVYPRLAAGLAALSAGLPKALAADVPFVRGVQAALHMTYAEHFFTEDLRDGHPAYGDTVHRLRVACGARTHEFFEPAKTQAADFGVFAREDFDALVQDTGLTRLGYEETFQPAGGAQLRLIEAVETRFRADDLVSTLPAGRQCSEIVNSNPRRAEPSAQWQAVPGSPDA